jgi:hypothetical protein
VWVIASWPIEHEVGVARAVLGEAAFAAAWAEGRALSLDQACALALAEEDTDDLTAGRTDREP